jgi:hypothetical protein
MNGGWGAFVVGLAVLSLVVTLPASLRDLGRGQRQRQKGFFGLGLSLTPFPLAIGLTYLSAYVNGVHISY